MNDIQNFLERKGAIVTGANGANKNGDDSSEDEEEEEEDDTLQDDELGHCLPKDDDHHNTGCVLRTAFADLNVDDLFLQKEGIPPLLHTIPILTSVFHPLALEEKRRPSGSAGSGVAMVTERISRRRGYQRTPHLIWDGLRSDCTVSSTEPRKSLCMFC